MSRRAFSRGIELPGDKSVTHRAIMFNGGAEEAVITNALMGGIAFPHVSACALWAPKSKSTERRRVRGTRIFGRACG
ncbi:MAG: hypothetical protein ACLS4Z_01895 [Christensenellaceae bacterium]